MAIDAITSTSNSKTNQIKSTRDASTSSRTCKRRTTVAVVACQRAEAWNFNRLRFTSDLKKRWGGRGAVERMYVFGGRWNGMEEDANEETKKMAIAMTRRNEYAH
jgi:hypothetical protein